MNQKPWLDKGYMYDRYVKQKKTITQIADECKEMGHPVTPMTIYNNLEKLDLLGPKSRKLGSRTIGGNSKKKGFYK